MLVRLSVLALLSGTATAQLFVDVRKQEMPAQWMHTETLFAGDLNGDGWSDVVVGGYSLESSPATTLNNDGHGRLLSGWRGGYFSRVAAVHDMDLDGDLDLVMEFDVAVNDGQGQFTRVSTGSHLPFTSVVTAAAVGDLTGDGLPDIYYARLFVNQGVLQFEPDLGSPSREGFYATGDVDGDGDLDLFAGGSLLANDGTGVFTDVSASLPATVSPYAQVVLQDLDADGDLSWWVKARSSCSRTRARESARTRATGLSGAGRLRATSPWAISTAMATWTFFKDSPSGDWLCAMHRASSLPTPISGIPLRQRPGPWSSRTSIGTAIRTWSWARAPRRGTCRTGCSATTADGA